MLIALFLTHRGEMSAEAAAEAAAAAQYTRKMNQSSLNRYSISSVLRKKHWQKRTFIKK